MNTKTKIHGTLKNLIIIFILFGAAATASGVDVELIDADLVYSSLDPGDDAVIKIEIENKDNDDPAENVDIEIYAEGYEEDGDDMKLEDTRVDIPAGETEEFNFTLNDLDPYRCGSFKIIVEVENEDETVTLRISGDDFEIDISPSKPSVDDEIKITIEDERNHKIENEDIRITNLDTGEYITEETDEDGVVEFTPSEEDKFEGSPAGTYEIMVDNDNGKIDPDYCSTRKSFIVKYEVDKKDIEVIDPKLPDVPEVGEQVTLQIKTTDGKPARYANVTITGPDFSKIEQTSSNGYIYFIPTSNGDYDIEITDERYSSVTKTIAIAAQTELSISFVSDPEVGEELTIIIKADGKAVDDAKVTVTDPEGQQKSFTTGADGKVKFDVKIIGEYEIDAEKSGYADGSKKFEVYKSFNIDIPESANVGDTVKVVVMDKEDNPIKDVAVKSKNCDFDQKTDSEGTAEFKIEELKDCKFSIEKDGFTTVERTISVEGELTLVLSPEKPKMNKELTILVLSGGMEAASDITITKPDGSTQSVEDSEYTFKPEQVGKYVVSASKSGYSDVSLDFNIAYNLINLTYDVVDGNLVFKVTKADGEPIPDAEVGIYATTNEEGVAVLEFDNNYDVFVMKENYETTKGPIEVTGKRDYTKIFMGILILILILIILILLLKGRKSKKESNGLKR